MQNDEVIWQNLRHNNCSYMAKIETMIFCRNAYNVTGLCNRTSCPLANSRYATIRDHDGVFYLYMKTLEKAHTPNKLWERVKLPRNYFKALEIINKYLSYWHEPLASYRFLFSAIYIFKSQYDPYVGSIKSQNPLPIQHVTTKSHALRAICRLFEESGRASRDRRSSREKIMTTPRKDIKREARREEKAEKAAVLDKSIEKELLERLKRGVYDDIYNYPVKEYNKVLDMEGLQAASEDEEEESEIEYVEGYEELEEIDDMEDFGRLAMNSYADDDNVGMDYDDEEMVAINNKRPRKESAFALRKLEKDAIGSKHKKKPRVLVEVELNDTDERQNAVH